MVALKKRSVNGAAYYYLEHSLRVGNRVEKLEKYLGSRRPKDLERVSQEFMEEIFAEKWYSQFDRIKGGYAAEKRLVPASAREKEARSFAIRNTYNTNRIEGSTLTYRETSMLIEEGAMPRSKPISDAKEAEAHVSVFLEMLETKKDVSLELILHFHRRLFEATKPDIAGRLRQHQVKISGTRFVPPLAVEVYPMLMEFLRWYGKNKKRMHPVHLAALAHLKLVSIHPFADGNGRLARLTMNHVLNRSKYPMLDIAYEHRRGYYHALERAQTTGNENIFAQWLFRRYLKENRRYLEERK